MITGESLYNLEGGFTFADDFKKQANDFKPLGYLVVFALRRENFFEYYASLLAIVDIYKKLSKIYEIDLGYKIDEFINSLRVSVSLLNKQLNHTIDKLTEFIYKRHNIKFLIEITDNKLIHLEGIQPGTEETETSYSNEFKKILENEF